MDVPLLTLLGQQLFRACRALPECQLTTWRSATVCTRRRMMWFQREEPGVAVGSGGPVGGFRSAGEGGAGEGVGAERDKESSANQAFRRSGSVRMTLPEAVVWICILSRLDCKILCER